MVLKAYTGFSDRQLVEHLNGNIHYQIDVYKRQVFFVCASTTLHDNGGVQTYKEYRLIRSGWEISGVLDPCLLYTSYGRFKIKRFR